MDKKKSKTLLPDLNPEPPIKIKHAHKFIFGYLVLIVLAAAIGGVYKWQHNKVIALNSRVSSLDSQLASTNNAKTAASSVIKPTSQPTTTETVATKLSLDYVATPGASESSQPLSVSVVVPTILRTQITNSTCINGDQGGPAGDSILEECLHLSFADKLGSGNSLMNSSHLSLWDAHDWLQRDEDNTTNEPFPIFGLTTIAQKQHAWQTLTSLTPATNLNAVFSSLPSLALDAAYISGIQKLTYVQSADGSLKGVAFVATIGQDEEYDPNIWVMMGGTIGSQLLLLTGSFQASDPTVLQINTLFQDHQSAQAQQLTAQAAAQLKAGKLSAQTLQAYSTVLPILKSIKLSTP